MLLREFLPSRSVEDILAERVRLTFGREEYVLRVLTIDETEVWQRKALNTLALILGIVEASPNRANAFGRIMGMGKEQLALIREYDLDGVLPDDKALRATATPSSLLKAAIEVLATAYPPAGVLLDAVVNHPEILIELLGDQMQQTPSSGPPPSTDGDLEESAAA